MTPYLRPAIPKKCEEHTNGMIPARLSLSLYLKMSGIMGILAFIFDSWLKTRAHSLADILMWTSMTTSVSRTIQRSPEPPPSLFAGSVHLFLVPTRSLGSNYSLTPHISSRLQPFLSAMQQNFFIHLHLHGYSLSYMLVIVMSLCLLPKRFKFQSSIFNTAEHSSFENDVVKGAEKVFQRLRRSL